MLGGHNPLFALIVAALALPAILGPATRAHAASDGSSAPAGHAVVSALATTEARSSSQYDQRDLDAKRREASLPLAAPDRAPRERLSVSAATPKTEERKPPRKNASRHARSKALATKAPVALQAGKRGPARIAAPAARGVAAVTLPVQQRAKPHVLATKRLPRELLIDRVASSDADEVMPAQPVMSVIRVPLALPSAEMAAELPQRAGNETVSLRATPLEPLDLN
jgi:hypothetical protein